MGYGCSSGAKECCLLLAKAANERTSKSNRIKQEEESSYFYLPDDFWRDLKKWLTGNNFCQTANGI